jgi:hypothetical protein
MEGMSREWSPFTTFNGSPVLAYASTKYRPNMTTNFEQIGGLWMSRLIDPVRYFHVTAMIISSTRVTSRSSWSDPFVKCTDVTWSGLEQQESRLTQQHGKTRSKSRIEYLNWPWLSARPVIVRQSSRHDQRRVSAVRRHDFISSP